MSNPQYPDISHHNTVTDFGKVRDWTKQWDGVSRVAIKLTEGTGFVDPKQDEYVQAAQAAGIDEIIYYHYARPDENKYWAGAQAEVDYFRKCLGNRMRASDYVMLDYEGFPGVKDSLFPGDWAWDWLHLCAGNLGLATSKVLIYSYDNFIRTQLQYDPLKTFPLVYAEWPSSLPSQPPKAPAPWGSTPFCWQFTDGDASKGRIAVPVPGITGIVDVNMWLGPVIHPAPPPDLTKLKADLQAMQASLSDALKLLG